MADEAKALYKEKNVYKEVDKRREDPVQEELYSILDLLWSISFNPVSALGSRKDDHDGDVQNYSWRQNAYSLENIIGSVLDEMGRFNSNFYDTDTNKHMHCCRDRDLRRVLHDLQQPDAYTNSDVWKNATP